MATKEGRASGKAMDRLSQGDAELKEWIVSQMFVPRYTSLVHMPVGVGE